MEAAQQANTPRASKPQQVRWAPQNPFHKVLLWYWAFAVPHGGKVLRVAFIQPGLGIIMALVGWLAGLLGWFSLSLVTGLAISVIGAVVVILSYLISHVYHKEYPGRFNARLEEYVARRVSRLSKDEFIPQYKARDYPATEKIRRVNLQARRALRVELERLAQSDRTAFPPVCGVLVVGPKHSNKTGALWDAMARELGGWTFVRWPHHMDHPANLALRVGSRIVLWIDNLHDFAHRGEAAALAQFIQQVQEGGRRLMVLASCRDGHHLQESEGYLRPLISELRRVPTKEELPPTQQIEELEHSYAALPEDERNVLGIMDWLQTVRVYTFPEEVLRVFSSLFPHTATDRDDRDDVEQESNHSWEDTIRELDSHRPRFVRVNQRADPRTTLSDETYSFVDWVSYNVLNKLPRPHKVVEPINVHYLDLERSRTGRAAAITTTLEQHPDLVIEVLADEPVASETLILLGDAYLNHLGETIDNAAELAILCYSGALHRLGREDASRQFPGAWAAAHIGRGIAELRLGRLDAADSDFREVTLRQTPQGGARPVPPMLVARAWHGLGDVIAANIPSAASTSQLDAAAADYQRAAEELPRRDPLWAETKLDRANVLFEIVRAEATQYAQPLGDGSIPSAPPGKLDDVRKAYQEAQQAYSQYAAPAVWAEIQRRLGELCLMEAIWLAPDDIRRYHPVGGAAPLPNPSANEAKALDTAKIARDHFIAAHNVFAPSYLPRAWAQTQLGLVRAWLIIAHIVAQSNPGQARAIYAHCLTTTTTTIEKFATLADRPIDWLDLQLLKAQAEIGLGALREADSEALYRNAKQTLERIDRVLSGYMRLPENPQSEHITAQQNMLTSLTEEVNQALPRP